MTYSHMGKPHTTIGAKTVSLLSSEWGQVVPSRYGRQAKKVNEDPNPCYNQSTSLNL